jgi:hypothetical protein
MTRSGPTLEGSLAEWQAGDSTFREWRNDKIRRFLWAALPSELISSGITGGLIYGKHQLENALGSEDAAMIMTRVALGGLPAIMTTGGAMLMRGMHLAATIPPIFSEVVSPFGPRPVPTEFDLESCEDWLLKGVRIGRWQALDGSGRAGAVARIPIIDEHTFIAARTRWGKSTCEWQILQDLSEAIKAGFVRVIIFDPKNGMEMAAAVDPMRLVAAEDFHWGENVGEPNNYDPRTTAPMLYEETFIKPLEDLVREMRRRGDHIRFKDVRHHAKPGDPHIIVMIDELAQLVRDTTPPPIARRITNAILTLQNQGAACGFTIIGCTQRPSIEEVGSVRSAFTQGMCGLVKSARAVDMVLDEGARKTGSMADKLDKYTRGVYYTTDSGNMVLRVCNSGPEWYDRDSEPTEHEPEPEVGPEDQEAADRWWQMQSSKHSAFHPIEDTEEQEAA